MSIARLLCDVLAFLAFTLSACSLAESGSICNLVGQVITQTHSSVTAMVAELVFTSVEFAHNQE